ncbi:MAG: hypothetical protein JSU61_04735, partial [Fidelibacterota bacterium]
MPWWKKTVRSIGKALVVLLVAAFTVIVFFPGLFTKYLQAYANRKYLNPMGLRVSYRGFVGDLFGAIKFSDITIAARNGSFTMRAEDASMSIDFLRLLRRDLSFNEVAVRSLDLELSAVDTPRVLERVEVERLPWIFVHKLRVEEGTVTRGDRDFWFRITGNLDLTGYISLEDARIDLVHPELEDTLRFASRQFAFDGQQFAISAGNLHYLGNQLSLDGQIKLMPELELDIRLKTEQFQRPELLPEWLSCSSLEGSLAGSLDSLTGSLSLGCSARDLPLDATNIDFKLIDEVFYLDRGLFARGEQRIDISGEIGLADRLDPGRGQLDLATSFRNTRLAEFLPDVPPLILDGDAHIRLGWQDSQIDSLQLALALQELGYQNRVFHSIHGGLEMKDMIWTITDTTHIRYAGSGIQLWGSVDAAREILDLEVYLQTDTLAGLLGSIGWLPLRGRANGQVWASGSWQNPSLTGAVMLHGTGYQRIGLGQAFIQFILDSALTQPTGRLYASTGELDLWGMPLEGGEAEFIFERDTLFASTLRLYRGLEKLDTRGFIALSDPVHIVLDTLTAWRNTEILAGGRIEAFRMGEEVILSPADVSIAGGRIGIAGDWSNVDNFNLSVQADQVDLVRVLRFFGKPPRFRGLVTGRSMISSRDGILALDGVLDAITGEIDRIPYTTLSSEFTLTDNYLTLQRLDLSHDKGRVTVTGVLTYAQSESGFGGLGGLDSLDLRGAFDLYQFHDLQPHLPWRFETHGALLGTFTAQGPAGDPVYTADLNARNPRFDRLTGDLLTGRLRYSNERLEFIDLALKTRVGSYSG